MAIGSGAVLTIRTDTRIHANAPASFTGSLSSPTFTDIGGELFIDATAVREISYTSGTGNAPAIGTTITSVGGATGYYLGCWASNGSAPVAVGAAIPASGIIKFREVTGAFQAGALSGISATCSGADRASWIEVVWDDATNFVVGRVGNIRSRGQWYELGTTNGSVGQTMTMPTTSSASTNNYPPGVFVETASGSGEYEFWPGLSSAANMWIKTALGFAEGYTDRRGRFVKSFGSGIIQFGETSTMSGTYVTVAGQASTYVGIAISSTYTWAADKVTVNTGATAHLFNDGQSVYLDFTSGSGTPDGNYAVTVLDAYNFEVTLAGSGTGGNVTVRPGVTVTFTAHGYNEGESIYADFTSGTGVDGTYEIYAVTGANTYNIAYPHSAALTGGNVTANGRLQATLTAHGMAVGNEVYLDFTSGGATDGRYIIRAVATNTIDINYPFSAAIASSNVTARWTIGYVPPTGCKVRIPNIISAACATGSRGTNSVPNATIATRPEFNTSTAGAIDLHHIYAINLRTIFAQPYSVALKYCVLQETLDISECATALDIDTVGVGSYSAQDVRAFLMTSNFAGGTVSNVTAMRPTIGTTDHAAEVLYCVGQTFNNIESGIIGYARSTGIALNIGGSSTLTFNGLRVFNGNTQIATSVNITINDLDYNDRFIGHTSSTTPYSAVTIAAGCTDITIDGVSFGMGNTIPDCHPYTGLVAPTNATRVKVRNVGSDTTYLQTGVWAPNLYGMGVAVPSAGNNNTLKLQKIFLGKLRTSILTTVNSDKNVLVEQVLSQYPWIHSAKAARTETLAWLNADIKGFKTGVEQTTGQTSVYGAHFYSLFRGGIYGSVLLAMNEPTAESTAYYSNTAGTVLFNSSGGVEMRAIGAQAIWETKDWLQGHTGFANVTPVMSGGTIGNYTLEYQIDTGSGWNGTWKTLNTTNLTAETVSSSTGFKLKVRITTGTTNSTAITYLRIYTTTTKAAQEAIAYPMDTNTVTFTGLPTGCDAVVLTAGTTTILDQQDAMVDTSYSYTYSGAQTVDVGFIKPGYVPYYIRNLSLGTTNSTIPVTLTPDRNYQ